LRRDDMKHSLRALAKHFGGTLAGRFLLTAGPRMAWGAHSRSPHE